jgi:guanine deaminase
MTARKTQPNGNKAIHERWLKRSIELASTGSKAGHGRPFGAVIVRDGKLVAEAHNEVISQNDPTAHAEVLAIRRAAAALGSRDLSACDVYVNGMPCPMCYSAMYWSGLRKIYYGCSAEQLAQIIGIDDTELYADLALPPAERRQLPAEQVEGVLDEAIACYETWGHRGHTRGAKS